MLMACCVFAKPEFRTIVLWIFTVFNIAAMMKSHKSIAKQIIALLMVIFEPYNFHWNGPSTNVYVNTYSVGQSRRRLMPSITAPGVAILELNVRKCWKTLQRAGKGYELCC